MPLSVITQLELLSKGENGLIDNVVIASQVLAKHDEKYMPREIKNSVKEY